MMNILMPQLIKCHRFKCQQEIQRRYLATVRLNDANQYEINLDSRRLKTPKGKCFQIKNESLAHFIAQEWNSQHQTIKRNEMHLTTLTNTQLDNPCNLTKEQIIQNFVDQLQSDTCLYYLNEPEELSNYLKEGWMPLVNEFEQTFNCRLPVTESVFLDEISSEIKGKLSNYLRSFEFNSLIGLQFILDNLKSVLLSLALINKTITVDDAARLSRLEQEFQIEKWGNVEWSHSLDLELLRSRVSSGLLFFILNNEFYRQIDKQIETN